MHTDQKIVVVKGSGGGGLGDRIRTVLTAILYAKLADRELFVDWDDGVYSQPGTNAFPKLFELRGVDQGLSIPSSDSVRPTLWKGNLGLTMHELYCRHGPIPWDRKAAIHNYSFDLSRLDYPEDVLVMWEFDQFSKLRNHFKGGFAQLLQKSDGKIMTELLQENLVLSEELQELVEKWKNSFFSKSVIGVHIRKTKEADCARGTVSLKTYHAELNRLLRGSPNARIFLATDNSEIIQDFNKKYTNTVTRKKWLANPGESLHLNPHCPDRLQNAIDAVVDMHLLSECNYLIYPRNSSFSTVSMYMSKAPPENISALENNLGIFFGLRRFGKLILPKAFRPFARKLVHWLS